MSGDERHHRVQHLVSAGGVVYRARDGHLEFVLCGQREPPRWSLPKGTPDESESYEATALREVREETGLEVTLGPLLGTTEYWFVRSQDRVRCHKRVHFYLMTPVGGDVSRHDPEFDEVRWFPAQEALARLTFPSELAVVQKAIDVVTHETARMGDADG
ncbi:MAG: NUDIX hydrolase [Dehalococcoidia bacterium]